MKADIIPEERKVVIHAKLQIEIKSGAAISDLHLFGEQNEHFNMIYNGSKIEYTSPLYYPFSNFTLFKKNEDTLNYRIYKLPAPLLPGDSAIMDIESTIVNEGFVNSGLTREILYNGTFYSGGLPSFGYNPQKEIESDEYLKKNGLKPKDDEYPPRGDSAGVSKLVFNDDADLIHFEAVLSTAPDQVAVAPGYLQRSWLENGRRHFHYIQDTPINYFYAIVSARYELLRDSAELSDGSRIDIEIYYDKKHEFNLSRFVSAYKDRLEYFSQEYGPFQYRQMRLLEFPKYAGFAQSFSNTVPFSESFAWVADFKDPDDFDYLYFVTAHELAHQWRGHQVSPNYTRGSNLISEALAEYTALLLTEKKYGKDNMKRFLKNELDGYLSGRGNEANKENVFINCNRPYQWYNKGSLVLYGLRDLIGDKALNTALREFRDSFALKPDPPFAGSNDLYAFITKHTPDSLRYYLTDTWEKIVLYDNKMNLATAKAVGKDGYDVTLDFSAKKMYADSSGKESVAAMNDYIDIAIFGEETRDANKRKKINPLYLRK